MLSCSWHWKIPGMIEESERKYHWPLGCRPDGHLELSNLGL